MSDFVISMYDKTQYEAGPKAKMDVINFLKKSDFKSIIFYFNGARKAELISVKQVLWDIPREIKKQKMQNVLFQYPAFNKRTNNKIIDEVKRKDGAQVFLLLHDVESLRLHRDEPEYIAEEIAFFNKSDGIIAHNEEMVKWLKQEGVVKPIVSLGIFDYDNPQSMVEHNKYEGTVCFAGNLGKSEFLKKIDSEVPFYLYGPNQAANYPENINYLGSYSPEELPKYLKQSFGLIWDGDSLTECNGIFGEYLRYNNPHKASLYLSSGLPVIIWKQAALASFVEQNGLGISINSLTELDKVMSNMAEEKYQEMCKNVRAIGQKIRKGYYIETAVQKLLEMN
ncbi:sugar transferase [Liquorilactobacillus hordei]|uniref:Beta-1,6-galactofuranosyltransferase n=2 Tax=Liquorilactobacillus hordei TaxID=468911 RepID=A0A0R1MNA2_9LACO|nr:sugar transferase [Liquorilactobacillus hordei]KRL07268.1 beta-1,6-galactofuranosyltransferase [Liquorilactobacillus hordei DSM 19519]QYH52929.1 sugar transferase [Liquorilactobacillus hordei DSM 19519]